MADDTHERGDASARLAGVRARFATRLVERIDALKAAVDRAKQPDGSPKEAMDLAHRLAGTAGSFGYCDAGDAAAALETLLYEGTLPGPDGEAAADWPAIEAALAVLVATSPTP